MSGIQTYILTGSNTQTWHTADLSDYDGFLYYVMGEGGVSTISTPEAVFVGSGSAGYVASGYVNLSYPYIVNQITVTGNDGSGKGNIKLYYDDDPSQLNIASPYIIEADRGDYYGNIINGNITYLSGFYNGAGDFGVIGTAPVEFTTQRNEILVGLTGASGTFSIESKGHVYDTTPIPVGGGYYGIATTGIYSGSSGPFGYGAGGGGSEGYVVISLITKNSLIGGSSNFYTSNTTNNVPPYGIMLASLLGGGGGGGDNLTGGGGGGGSGEMMLSLMNVLGTTGYNVNVGLGGGVNNDGGSTFINNIRGYSNGLTGSIYTYSCTANGGKQGGSGTGSNIDGDGGDGYYGGGLGLTNANTNTPNEGISVLNINSYYSNTPSSSSGFGGGSVNAFFGQGETVNSSITVAGGGGGGPYGGDGGYLNILTPVPALDGFGFGCGGGGGSSSIGINTGIGSTGYAITSYLDPSIYKLYNVTGSSSITLTNRDFLTYDGMWFFLNGGNATPSFNMGHFLIDEDGVNNLTLTTNTISINFNSINGKGQNVTLIGTTGVGQSPSTFSSVLLYKYFENTTVEDEFFYQNGKVGVTGYPLISFDLNGDPGPSTRLTLTLEGFNISTSTWEVVDQIEKTLNQVNSGQTSNTIYVNDSITEASLVAKNIGDTGYCYDWIEYQLVGGGGGGCAGQDGSDSKNYGGGGGGSGQITGYLGGIDDFGFYQLTAGNPPRQSRVQLYDTSTTFSTLELALGNGGTGSFIQTTGVIGVGGDNGGSTTLTLNSTLIDTALGGGGGPSSSSDNAGNGGIGFNGGGGGCGGDSAALGGAALVPYGGVDGENAPSTEDAGSGGGSGGGIGFGNSGGIDTSDNWGGGGAAGSGVILLSGALSGGNGGIGISGGEVVGGNGVDYTGGGGGGGVYRNGNAYTGGNGGRGYAILKFSDNPYQYTFDYILDLGTYSMYQASVTI